MGVELVREVARRRGTPEPAREEPDGRQPELHPPERPRPPLRAATPPGVPVRHDPRLLRRAGMERLLPAVCEPFLELHGGVAIRDERRVSVCPQGLGVEQLARRGVSEREVMVIGEHPGRRMVAAIRVVDVRRTRRGRHPVPARIHHRPNLRVLRVNVAVERLPVAAMGIRPRPAALAVEVREIDVTVQILLGRGRLPAVPRRACEVRRRRDGEQRAEPLHLIPRE